MALAYAATSPMHSLETKDLVVAALRFADGAVDSISATTCAYPGFSDQIELIGERDGMAKGPPKPKRTCGRPSIPQGSRAASSP